MRRLMKLWRHTTRCERCGKPVHCMTCHDAEHEWEDEQRAREESLRAVRQQLRASLGQVNQ